MINRLTLYFDGGCQPNPGPIGTAVVVRGVIEMARSLGLAVVAEGVETQAQLGLLARAGCNYYQGFLCAPPIEAAEVERLVIGEQRAAG